MPYTHPAFAATGWSTRAEAHAHVTSVDPGVYDPRAITYTPTDDERDAWHARERSRLADGTYTPAPWPADLAIPQHYAHRAKDAEWPDLAIAYTETEERGYLDKQTRTTVGRYLAKYYPDWPISRRTYWLECWRDPSRCNQAAPPTDGAPPPAWQVARTADDIERVYRRSAHQSCMGPDGHANFPPGHPTRAYGDSDLALAYLADPNTGRSTARTVIWSAMRTYSRCYGTDSPDGGLAALEAMLQIAGWTRAHPIGARIRAIPHPRHAHTYIVPYVDGIESLRLSDDGQWLVAGPSTYDDRRITGQSTSGYATRAGYAPPPPPSDEDGDECYTCDHCGDRECTSTDDDDLCPPCADSRYTCQHCNGYTWDDNDSDSTYCDDCEARRRYCEMCESDHWPARRSTVYQDADGRQVCADCATTSAESHYVCQHCHVAHYEYALDSADQTDRTARGLTLQICPDCDEDGIVVCHACASPYAAADVAYVCPDCHVPDLCQHTLNLLTECS